MTFLESLLAPALVVALFLGPLTLLLSLVFLWKRFVRNRNRRSPLTTDLLRTPGFGLQDRIEELGHDIAGTVMGITWVPLTLFAIYQLQPENKLTALLFVIIAVGVVIHETVTVIRQAEKRQKYREALAGELATAQLLEPIVAYGGRILHDIQAPGFNIDHVVVAPGGVFAIET